MYCLHCGDCCKRMSPLTGDEHTPCPRLKQVDTFYFCGAYNRRPKECVNHKFDSRFCPIGMDVLGLNKSETVQPVVNRIDEGYKLCRGMQGGKDENL